jgi:ABC-type antimicrobial peptide transport system permease subunit
MPLLTSMEKSSSGTLLIGLIFDIIILLFVVVSILLIYSLLMISMETKTFENGVLRMIGTSKSNNMLMILIQSFIYVLPSIVCGYISSILALSFLFNRMFKS